MSYLKGVPMSRKITIIGAGSVGSTIVSYTHLDVYKGQLFDRTI